MTYIAISLLLKGGPSGSILERNWIGGKINYCCFSSIAAWTLRSSKNYILTSPYLTSWRLRVNLLFSNFLGCYGITLQVKLIFESSSIFLFSLIANLSSISWKFKDDSDIISLGATGLLKIRHSWRSKVAVILKSWVATLSTNDLFIFYSSDSTISTSTVIV